MPANPINEPAQGLTVYQTGVFAALLVDIDVTITSGILTRPEIVQVLERLIGMLQEEEDGPETA